MNMNMKKPNNKSNIKKSLLSFCFLIASLSGLALAAPDRQPLKLDFSGATPMPVGLTQDSVSQIQVQFPKGMDLTSKGSLNPFQVRCTPDAKGYSSWANNETIWTYNFKAMGDEYSTQNLPGGSQCVVTQMEELKSKSGQVWPVGTIKYEFTVHGPKVTNVFIAHGFKEMLREKEPLFLILFNGPVAKESIFANQASYLNYLSANAPSERIPLVAIPEDQSEKVFNEFKNQRYFDSSYEDKNWVLATVRPNLIAGASLALNISNQVSAVNPKVIVSEKFTQEYTVRNLFQAEIQCERPTANESVCMPDSVVTVALNGRVKWTDIRKTYIEYLPYKSTDNKKLQAFAVMSQNNEVDLWNVIVDYLSQFFPYLEKYSDTVVDSVRFDVKIEPNTLADVVLPQGLIDIDNRQLSNALTVFHIRIGNMREWLNTPQQVAVYEKNIPNLSLPVGIVNLNQKLVIRKSGQNSKTWQPIKDIPQIVQLIRSYASQDYYRTTKEYTSPMDLLKIKNTVVEEKLTGKKNRPEVLQFPFSKLKTESGGALSNLSQPGIYAIEISNSQKETENSSGSSAAETNYPNPRSVVAQVTNLAIHLKKGEQKSLVWITELSSAKPVAGASVSIYNCLGEKVQTFNTNSQGLASFKHLEWAKDCNINADDSSGNYDIYSDNSEFFIVAEKSTDLTLVHSSWRSNNDYALNAPGIDWYYTKIVENRPSFHGIIGINLVKPGQQVPIQIIAKTPVDHGFAEVANEQLPKVARIVSQADSNIFYELPLNWHFGTAAITWQVPNDSSTKLGSYAITLVDPKNSDNILGDIGEIEVAEFKVPLMTGLLGLPEEALVKPNTLPVHTLIRYANGTGAKNIKASLSYYFEPTLIDSKDLPDFIFGSGPVKTADSGIEEKEEKLQSSNRPALIEDLKTKTDGSFTVDIAKELAPAFATKNTTNSSTTNSSTTIGEVLKSIDRPQKLVARVRYQDQMGEFQTISTSKTIYNAKEFLGTHLISGTRSSAKLQAAVIDVNDKRVTDLNDLTFQVNRIETRVIGEELFGGLIKNTLERQIKPAAWTSDCRIESGIVSCGVGTLKAGNYSYQVNSKSNQQFAHLLFKVDSEGRVYGQSDFYNFGDENQGKYLPLGLNKATYKEGEKAVVSFSSPFKTCRALVTIERNEVMDSFISENACEKGFVEIPVHATLAPNAFVAIYAITGRADSGEAKIGEQDLGRPTYRLGFANLKVDWDHFKSNVKLALNQDTFKPGQMVEVQAQVSPSEGALAQGTVTFIAIEEKILELKANDTYQILDALMQLRGHSVATATGLEHLESTAKYVSSEPNADARKGGDEGGDGSSKSEFKRKLFNALVAFQADVPVVDGIAKYSFKANDSLTKFKVIAIAMDSANKFGTGEVSYLSSQATQTYSNIPAVAYSGDQFPITVTIQNNSLRNASYRIGVIAQLKDKSGKVIDTKSFGAESSISASGSEAISLGRMEVEDKASRIEYAIKVYDENGNVVDSLEPDAQEILPSVPVTLKNSYLFAMEQDNFTQSLKKPEGSLEGKGQIQFSVAKSLVESAIKQIRDNVARDPFSDFFIEAQFNKAFLTSSSEKNGELKKLLESFIGKTDSNGMVKYYSGATRGSVFLTARILNVLGTQKWAMSLLPSALKEKMKLGVEKVLNKSIDPSYVIGDTPMSWLRAQVAMGQSAYSFGDKKLEAQSKTLMDSILGELARNPKNYGTTPDQWSNSDLVSLWMLQNLTTKTRLKDSQFYQLLINPSRMVYMGNSASLKGRPSYSVFYSDETIETALLLVGHSQMQGSADLARSLAVGLVNSSVKAWYNSSTMLTVALALQAFSRSYEAEAVTGISSVTVPEENVSATADWSNSSLVEVEFNSPWSSDSATVKLSHSGQGHPWFGIQTFSAVPLTEPVGQGLSITKTIRNLTSDSGFKPGDVIEVELNINAAAAVEHVAMQDPIPAGSNIINEAYGAYSSGEKRYSGYWLYFSRLNSGVNTVKYQYQLNNPGIFKMAPTRVQALYTPSVFAEAPNGILNVK